MPDLRTRRGKRDRALLMLLGAAGLRRAEACALTYADLEELRRHPTPRRRNALVTAGERTAWVVHVREPKRGRARTVDLAKPVVEAIRDWTRSRPDAPTDHLFVSLPRNRPPGPLRPRAVNALVDTYATKAGLPEDRRTPHVLHHTFCTLLAESGAGLEVVAELAGHADLRTTKGYVPSRPAAGRPPSTRPSTPTRTRAIGSVGEGRVAADLAALAYQLALRSLDHQESGLDELHARTNTLLAAAAVSASFLGAPAIRDSRRRRLGPPRSARVACRRFRPARRHKAGDRASSREEG